MIAYADLQGIAITESKIPNLQKLPENFYEEFKEIFKSADEKHKEYLKNIFDEIYSLRLRKIFMHALRTILGEVEKPENILKEEEEIYHKILEIIEEKKKFFEKNGNDAGKKEKEYKKVKVKFLKECPAIVGLDLKRYGPFKENDIALVIEEQSKIFVENKFAEVVEWVTVIGIFLLNFFGSYI